MLFHNKANSLSQKSGYSSIVKSTLKVCFMCQAREFGRCTSFGTLPKTVMMLITSLLVAIRATLFVRGCFLISKRKGVRDNYVLTVLCQIKAN